MIKICINKNKTSSSSLFLYNFICFFKYIWFTWILFTIHSSYDVIPCTSMHYTFKSSEETFLDFINDLHNNLSILESQRTYKQSVINHMNNEIDKLIEDINRYASVYILMDRISLSTAITIFRCCNIQLRKHIFQTLLQLNSTVGYKTFESFDDFLTRLPSVRNFVCHFNSLEVLVNYLYIPTKTLRTPTDRKKYLNIIRKLSQ